MMLLMSYADLQADNAKLRKILLEVLEDDVGGCECCVATEVHFQFWSEPTQIVVVFLWDEEGSLGEVVFGGD